MHVSSESGDYVSIHPAEPSGDDILVVVDVRTRGFTGCIDTWILRSAWLQFCDQLNLLESRRHGEAIVESISPQELRLSVRGTDRAGHMAVEGLIDYRGALGQVLLSFSPIAFDPSTLPGLLREAREIAG